VAETQQRANDAETLRYIGAVRDLLRDADSHVRLRTYKERRRHGRIRRLSGFDRGNPRAGAGGAVLSLAGSAAADGRE
jgi:hypothetical protein